MATYDLAGVLPVAAVTVADQGDAVLFPNGSVAVTLYLCEPVTPVSVQPSTGRLS